MHALVLAEWRASMPVSANMGCSQCTQLPYLLLRPALQFLGVTWDLVSPTVLWQSCFFVVATICQWDLR